MADLISSIKLKILMGKGTFMLDKEIIKMSKFMSLILRHNPQKIGITLDEKGWADTSVPLEYICSDSAEL